MLILEKISLFPVRDNFGLKKREDIIFYIIIWIFCAQCNIILQETRETDIFSLYGENY